MITKVEAVNYKCLRNISRPLGRFHVLAGPNGSGKSTFFEVLKVLGAFASDGLEAVWHESRASQLSEVLSFGKGRSFQMAVEMAVPDRVLGDLGRAKGSEEHGRKTPARKGFVRYEVEIGYGRDTDVDDEASILAENLWLMDRPTETNREQTVEQLGLFPSPSRPERLLIQEKRRTPAGWRRVASKSVASSAHFRSETTDWNFPLKNPPQRSAMSTLPEDDRFGIAGWAKTALTQNVQTLMLRSEAMQQPCPPLKDRRFLPDGSTLPFVIRRLRRDRRSFHAWLEHVKTVLPIRDIRVIVREEDKHRYLKVIYASGLKVNSWHLSDGTLRLLVLTMLPYIDNPGMVYLIEEPENGVHPPAIEAIYSSLSSIFEGQALVATHSPVLVGLIGPDQLLCFSQTEDGETDIEAGDRHPRLKHWQEDFRLAQLFAAGILG